MGAGPHSSEHVLGDGTRVEIRPIRPEDRDELARGFARLSPASRYRRFLAQTGALSDETLRYLTEVDGKDHVALVATTPSHDLRRDVGLGVARFIRLPDEPDVAEAAITVADEAQGKGLGKLLLAELCAAARRPGVPALHAEVLASNAPMRHILGEIGAVVRASEGDTVLVEIPLGQEPADADAQRAHPMSRLMRGVAEALASLRARMLAAGAAPLRRVGAIGDVHAEDEHLAIALEHLRAARVDLVLAVGDLCDGRGDLRRCCELLHAAGAVVVRGNHERWLLGDTMRDVPDAHRVGDLDPTTRAFLESLPATRRFETTGGGLLLCHGLGDDDMAMVMPDDPAWSLDSNEALCALRGAGDVAFVIHGHSHRRMARTSDGITLLNAGTLYRHHRPCFLVADFSGRRAEFFDLAPGGGVVAAERIDLP